MENFEEYFRTTKHYENMLLEIARNQLSVSVFDKNGRKYRNHIVQTAYEVFQHQQAKVGELQKQLSEYIFVAETIDEMYVKEVQKSDELQKRVDAVKGLAQTLWEKSNEKHTQGKVWESKALGECADEILDVIEQAIKGGGQ
nr:hypothetical protein [Acinetobacter baumannii]